MSEGFEFDPRPDLSLILDPFVLGMVVAAALGAFVWWLA